MRGADAGGGPRARPLGFAALDGTGARSSWLFMQPIKEE